MFKKLYNFLFNSCQHEWKTINAVTLVINNRNEIPTGFKYILQCKKCGNIKTKTI